MFLVRFLRFEDFCLGTTEAQREVYAVRAAATAAAFVSSLVFFCISFFSDMKRNKRFLTLLHSG